MTQINPVLSENLELFAARFPDLTDRLSTIPHGLIHAAATEDGNYCYVKKLDNQQWQPLSQTEKPLAAAVAAVSSMEDRIVDSLAPAVVIGLNPGYVLDIVFQHFKKNSYKKHKKTYCANMLLLNLTFFHCELGNSIFLIY